MSKRLFVSLMLATTLVFASFTGTAWSSQKVAGDAVQQKTLHSSKELVVTDTTKPVVVVTTPSSIISGALYTVKWTATDASGISSRTVDFYNGSTWVNIGTPLNVDTLRWTVVTVYAPIDSCRFRITVVDGSPNANTTVALSGAFRLDTACFSIVAITMPAQVSIGTSYKITWNEDLCSGYIISRVLLWSKNNGTTYDTLAKPTTNSFMWNVPSPAIGQCRVRVIATEANNRTHTATSGQFAILGTGIKGTAQTHTVSDYFGISTMGKTVRLGVNAGAYSVKVYDLAGRLLISRNAVATQEMYQNIPVKSSNVSIVRLEQAGKIVTKKVMLQ